MPQPQTVPEHDNELEEASCSQESSALAAQVECGWTIRCAGYLLSNASRLPAMSATTLCVDLCRFQA